jgi:hypothetical protein
MQGYKPTTNPFDITKATTELSASSNIPVTKIEAKP